MLIYLNQRIEMGSIKSGLLLFCVSLALTLVQGSPKMSQNEEMDFEMKLKLLNKPALKSFQTKYGDILDCVEIHKQLAFDHPLLKNHSIQMKPNIPKLGKPSSSRFMASKLGFPKNIKCPKGTVIVKRIVKEDLLSEKLSQSLGMKFQNQGQNQIPYSGHHVATLVLPTQPNSRGAHGKINVWGLQPLPDQYTSAFTFVGREDGTMVANGVAAGWMVNPSLYPNNTRLFAYWTKDSGKTTGCQNMLCPGFVQVNTEITLGIILQPLSTFGGEQYDIEIGIQQDRISGNWWLQFERKQVGYYPKELFTTLGEGASNGGWGGEVYSPQESSEPTPAMGSGHYPFEGWGFAAYIRQMFMVDQFYAIINPKQEKLQENFTNPLCYNATFNGFDIANNSAYYMFFGGPPRC